MTSLPASRKSAGSRSRKRQDIQILRAVAVLAVVGYHFGITGFDYGFLGVDIFLVISGYLVGGGLLSEYKKNGRLDLRRFFTHRIKRLLPASIVVVVATTVLLYVIKVLTTRDLWHALWSSLYVQNINLSIEGGDYLGKDLLPTYFVHFWSLSLEEQFYVFTPIVLLLAALIKFKRPLIIFSIIGIASLVYSVYQTSAGDSSAYFSLTTRAWQFILGMVVANLNPSKLYAWLLWIISFIGLASFALLINFQLGILFPAPGAIIPSVITALALAAGKTIPLRIPVLGLQPTGVFLGDLSYSIYLVHFPISLLVASWAGETHSWIFVAGGLALTFALAFVLKTFVEDPVRYPGFYGKKLKIGTTPILLGNIALALSLILTIQGFSVAANIQTPDESKTPVPTAEQPTAPTEPVPNAENCYGAKAMTKDVCGAFILSKPLLPPQSANEAKTKAYVNGCHIPLSPRPHFKSCTYGAKTDYKTTIALVGDSHATQWLPGFEMAGKASGVRVKTFLMSECVFGAVIIHPNCNNFASWVLKTLEKPENGFSAIYISNRVSRSVIQTKSAYIQRSFTAILETLKRDNIKVFFIEDTPLGTLDQSDPNICLLSKKPKDCYGLTRNVRWGNPFAKTIQDTGLGEFIPVQNLFCIGNKCYRSIGGVPVYRDDDHINVWFSKSTSYLWQARFDALLKEQDALPR